MRNIYKNIKFPKIDMTKNKIEEITLIGTGKTIEEAFSKAAINMFQIVIDVNSVKKINTKTIIFRCKDLKTALFQFLKKLYDITSNETFILSDVKTLSIEEMSGEYLVTSVLIGEKLNSEHKIKDIIKQVTDRNVLVQENKNGSIAQLSLIVERRVVE